jgi:AraC-like DNA-binding protein
MKIKKPFLEYVQPTQGLSIRVHYNQETQLCAMKSWHYHPEIELVCIPQGKGRLYIGNQLFSYENGVIILLNSNIPHTSFDYGYEGETYEEYVVQISPDQLNILLEGFEEFEQVKKLIHVAKEGIVFPLTTDNQVFRDKCRALPMAHALKKWLLFIEVLDELSQVDYTILGVASGNNLHPIQAERIQKVFDYIAQHFTQPISSQVVADWLNLTDSSFCRFFQKHTQKTFKQVLNEYRINHACKLLAFSEKSIELIAYESGYSSQSFFNRVFKEIRQITPLAYRRSRQADKYEI